MRSADICEALPRAPFSIYGAPPIPRLSICEAPPRTPHRQVLYGALPRTPHRQVLYGAPPQTPVKGLFEKSPLTIPKNFCPDTAIKTPPQGVPHKRQARKSTEESKLSSVLFLSLHGRLHRPPLRYNGIIWYNVQSAILAFCG